MAAPASPVILQQPRDPPTFHGAATEDLESWLEFYERITTFNNSDSDDKLWHAFQPPIHAESNEASLTKPSLPGKLSPGTCGGGHLITPMSRCMARVNIWGFTYIGDFVIHPECSKGLIHGMDFLQVNGAIIDLQESRVTFATTQAIANINDNDHDVALRVADDHVTLQPKSSALTLVRCDMEADAEGIAEANMPLLLERLILRRTSITKPRIITDKSARPVRQHPYRKSPVEMEAIKYQVKEMLQDDVTKLSTSPWASPAVLRMMDTVLAELKWQTCLVYLDDIVVFASTFDEHFARLESVLATINTAGLTIKPEKCYFWFQELKFLGHVVGPQGIRPDPDKLAAIAEFSPLTDKKAVQRFLGLWAYYRRFVEGFSRITQPLTQPTRDDVPLIWACEQQQSFNEFRKCLQEAPILAHFDEDADAEIHTDASNAALGAVLVQWQAGVERSIAYASRSLTKAEKNYSTTEKECLAVVWAFRKFRPCLYGRPFEAVRDHHAVCWLANLKSH
ncbi:uncharacterized protein [Dermacentor albipictus]|uniref:uncharacterized protein n=1 Tax=Dermacentor albipictus TaxID=60249 RepID=UPI0031FCE68D